MRIRLERNPVAIGEAVRGAVVLDREGGGYRQVIVALVRTETADGRAVEAREELIRLERPASGEPIAGEVAFAGETTGQLPTYRGVRLAIAHRIEVNGETSSGEQRHERTALVLRAGSGLPVAPTPPAPWTLAPLVGGSLLAAAIVLVVVTRGALEATLAALVNAVIGVALVVPAWRRRRWGWLKVTWQPRRPAVGDEVLVRAEVRRRRPWTLTRAVVSLEAEEVVDVPDADGHGTERSSLLALSQPLFAGRRGGAAGEMVSLRATLSLPGDAPPTFRCGSGGVEWQIRLSLEGDHGGRDEVQPIVVGPASPPAAGGGAERVQFQEISEERS